MGSTHRPLGVTIVGGLEFILGLILLVMIILSAFVSGINFNLNLNNTVATVIAGVIIGGIPMVIGYGMLKGWSIMWWLGVIFNVIAVVGGLLTFPAGLIGTIVSVIILIYLFKKDVKAFFR